MLLLHRNHNRIAMSQNLIKVGNSNAIIIPARIIKKRGYTSLTEFDIIEVNDGIKLVHKTRKLEDLQFPRIARPVLSDKIKGLTRAVKFTPQQIENDERLKYILSR